MTKKIYMVLIVQNTGAFPYNLAADLKTSAQASGQFTLVKVVTPYESVRTLLMQALERRPESFDTDCLALKVPWAPAAATTENRHKFATCFIEGCEGLEIGIEQSIFLYNFKGVLKRIVEDAPDDSKILLIVSDVRRGDLFSSLRNPGSCHNFVAVRATEVKSRRTDIKCNELDNSYLETFPQDCKASAFHSDLTSKSSADEIDRLKARINAMPVELE